MSTFIHTCSVCGAEAGLDMILADAVTDADTRRIIGEVVAVSLPLGADVLRYLALHKPPKQRLRLPKARDLLIELITDIRRGAITRAGREWVITPQTWRAGFEAVHAAHAAGTLTPPLDGLGYLYTVLMRMADQAEGAREADALKDHRSGVTRMAPPAIDHLPSTEHPATPSMAPVGIPSLPAKTVPSDEVRARLVITKAMSAINRQSGKA